jgi:hypothetical protein
MQRTAVAMFSVSKLAVLTSSRFQFEVLRRVRCPNGQRTIFMGMNNPIGLVKVNFLSGCLRRASKMVRFAAQKRTLRWFVNYF